MGNYSHVLSSLSANHRIPVINLLDFPYLNIVGCVKYKRGLKSVIITPLVIVMGENGMCELRDHANLRNKTT